MDCKERFKQDYVNKDISNIGMVGIDPSESFDDSMPDYARNNGKR